MSLRSRLVGHTNLITEESLGSWTCVDCTETRKDQDEIFIRHIHCTHWKLNVQQWIANRQRMSRKLNVMGCKTIAINWDEFIATDLENYTSYEDKIKSSVELKESSNFDADFKPDINCTVKLLPNVRLIMVQVWRVLVGS